MDQRLVAWLGHQEGVLEVWQVLISVPSLKFPKAVLPVSWSSMARKHREVRPTH